jgi:cell division protein FtsX
VTGLKTWLVEPVRGQLLAVYAATGVILLIACLNVSNLLLIRGTARRKEVAIRCALGSTRWHLMRQWFSEYLILAVLGGVAGLLLAVGGRQAILGFTPDTLGIQDGSAFDGPVLASALVVSILAAFLFGAVPALRLSAGNLRQILGESGRAASPGKSRHRAMHGLVAGQIAITTVLLVAAGLAVVSFRNLTRADPGFTKNNAISFRVGHFPDRQTGERVVDALSALPGVESVGGSHIELLNDVFSNPVRITLDGRSELSGPAPPPVNFWEVKRDIF